MPLSNDEIAAALAQRLAVATKLAVAANSHEKQAAEPSWLSTLGEYWNHAVAGRRPGATAAENANWLIARNALYGGAAGGALGMLRNLASSDRGKDALSDVLGTAAMGATIGGGGTAAYQYGRKLFPKAFGDPTHADMIAQAKTLRATLHSTFDPGQRKALEDQIAALRTQAEGFGYDIPTVSKDDIRTILSASRNPIGAAAHAITSPAAQSAAFVAGGGVLGTAAGASIDNARHRSNFGEWARSTTIPPDIRQSHKAVLEATTQSYPKRIAGLFSTRRALNAGEVPVPSQSGQPTTTRPVTNAEIDSLFKYYKSQRRPLVAGKGMGGVLGATAGAYTQYPEIRGPINDAASYLFGRSK